MIERLEQPTTVDSRSELGELCARATELVRGLPGPVRRVTLRTGDHGVDIEWAGTDEPSTSGTAANPAAGAPAGRASPNGHASSHGLASAVGPVPPAGAGGADDTLHVVRAPLVGTFYVAPRPGAAPFVAVGDLVEAGQTIGLVEAMKLMNHVEAEQAGRVVEILVENREPVEFDQPLIRLALA